MRSARWSSLTLGMEFNSPLSLETADQLIARLPVQRGGRVIDVGCGNGAFLRRVAERKGVTGLGVDRDASVIATARAAGGEGVEFLAGDATKLEVSQGSYDLAICLGSTHAYGVGEVALPRAVEALARMVKPGGAVLLGEGYWKQEPAPDYLALLGEPTGIYRDHAGNIAFLAERGLVTRYATVSSEAEWDAFEEGHQERIERAAAAVPEDAQLALRLQGRRVWMDGYRRWGRTTMGFGFYLCQTPG